MVGTKFIGETRVDLEKRFYSKTKAACGLSEKYDKFGYNRWRDVDPPSTILKNLCKLANFEEPNYDMDARSVEVAAFGKISYKVLEEGEELLISP